MSAPSRTHLVEQPPGPLLVRLALPNLAATLIMSSLTVTEGWYVGKLGTIELAGVALVFPLYMLMNMLSAGAIGGAVSAAAARAQGKRDARELEGVLRSAIVLALVGGLVLSWLLWQFGSALFTLLGASPQVRNVSEQYAGTFAIGATILWLFNLISAVLRGAGDMRRPAIATFIVAVTHFLLCPLLIIGTRWTPSLEVHGAAIAVVLAYLAGLVLVLGIVSRDNNLVRFRWGTLPRSVLMPIVKNGLLASNQSVMTICLALFTSALVGRLGTEWLAGYGIGIRLELLMIVIIFGVGGPLITIAGANVGAGMRQRALSIAWRGIAFIVLWVGAIGVIAAVFPSLWTSLFTDDPLVRNACKQYLQIVGPFYAFFALGLGLYFVSQAFQTMLLPVLGTALRLVVVFVGAECLIALDWVTPTAVFVLLASAMMIYGLFVALALRFGPWRA